MESRLGTAVVATAIVAEREGESGLAKEDRQHRNHRPVFSQGVEVQPVIGIAFLNANEDRHPLGMFDPADSFNMSVVALGLGKVGSSMA